MPIRRRNRYCARCRICNAPPPYSFVNCLAPILRSGSFHLQSSKSGTHCDLVSGLCKLYVELPTAQTCGAHGSARPGCKRTIMRHPPRRTHPLFRRALNEPSYSQSANQNSDEPRTTVKLGPTWPWVALTSLRVPRIRDKRAGKSNCEPGIHAATTVRPDPRHEEFIAQSRRSESPVWWVIKPIKPIHDVGRRWRCMRRGKRGSHGSGGACGHACPCQLAFHLASRSEPASQRAEVSAGGCGFLSS